jgi:alkanesulfonate monooxygenase SsuD/methylene tetrahydromethanopterin reductase-like flavin-dependent oxidoreductase (luciferase family)
MTDYGHELEFGYFLIPEAGDPHGVPETARLADRLGYDLLAVQDHPYRPTHLDALALLGVILAQTDRIRVFQDVGNLPLRPPAAFAKAAATLDLLSGGRFEVGLGAAGFLDAGQAMGASARTPGQSLEALEEAIVILRAWWSTAGVLWFHGRHYELEGARPGPKPAHSDPDLLRIFIEDVAPDARERVAAARGEAATAAESSQKRGTRQPTETRA